MDLIYTNANGEDQGILSAYAFDLSFGASENDFEISAGVDESMIEFGAFVYMEGTEYGGIVDTIKTSTNGETITYRGRTWHGILNSKVIQPDSGEDYLVVSGDANEVLSALVARLGLPTLFVADERSSGVNIPRYQFARYCKGYDGIRAMLAANGAKLKMELVGRSVQMSAEPIADYTDAPVDGDIATLTVEQTKRKVNHLICLGQGDLAEREVVHLYVDQYGGIGTVQYYTGLDEYVDTYENSNSTDLEADGIKRLTELQNNDRADIALSEYEGLSYDIGDIVGAIEYESGVKVTSTVAQKIVKIKNGVVSVEYKTGERSVTTTSSGGGSSGGGGSSSGGTDIELPVSIANGGTGATTAEAARANLGAASIDDEFFKAKELTVTTANQTSYTLNWLYAYSRCGAVDLHFSVSPTEAATSWITVATLPEGYRPPQNIYKDMPYWNATSGNAHLRMRITTAGAIQFNRGSAGVSYAFHDMFITT